VIGAINWAVNNKDVFNIRILNLSFSAPPQSFYWDDPLNQAVMHAWQKGIVVVAAAGNSGPEAMTVGVPGNVPYIITVGAISDNYTIEDQSDDFLTSFSAAGPTEEAFVKPDVVAPGGHVIGLMNGTAQIAQTNPKYHLGNSYFMMSGTSQATAITSGIVALMLQADASLTPDDVKCRLMANAQPALNQNGTLAYSIFQQGAGLVNAQQAVNSTLTGCANSGLNIANDLAGIEHYVGRAAQDDQGNYGFT
jgi:serine protease AprX